MSVLFCLANKLIATPKLKMMLTQCNGINCRPGWRQGRGKRSVLVSRSPGECRVSPFKMNELPPPLSAADAVTVFALSSLSRERTGMDARKGMMHI